MSTTPPAPEVVAALREQLAADAQQPGRVKTSDWVATRARILAQLEPSHSKWISSLRDLGLTAQPYPANHPNQRFASVVPVPGSRSGVTVLLDRETLASTGPPVDGRTAAVLADESERRRKVTNLTLEGAPPNGSVQPDPPPSIGGGPGERPNLRIVRNNDERTRS